MNEDFIRGLEQRTNQPFVLFAIVLPLLIAFSSSDYSEYQQAKAASINPTEAITGGLDWLIANQSRRGNWTANEGRYPTAMTALAGTALSSKALRLHKENMLTRLPKPWTIL